VRTGFIKDFARIQEHDAPSDARKIMLHIVVFHGSSLREIFPQEHAKLRNIPLAVTEVIQELAQGIHGIDFERQIEGLARGNDAKILIKNNKRFPDGVDDSVCKLPGVLDVSELLSKDGETPSGRESKSLARPVAAEDNLSLCSLCAVRDTNRCPAAPITGLRQVQASV
jgi:hypothetical protein